MNKDKPRLIILGAGISGLALAYRLKDHYDLIILEKESHAGGWMQSETKQGFFFENGPRTFKTSRCLPLIRLATELGVPFIEADKSAHVRYLWLDGKIQRFPRPLFSWPILYSLVREWSIPSKKGEESIYDFATRRFCKEVADRFFDPLIAGIFAGDIRKLSMQSCLPFFKSLEETYGSITKGLFRQKKSPKAMQADLFSFEGGTSSLITALTQSLESSLHLGCSVQALDLSNSKVKVETSQGSFTGDLLVSTLPPHVLAPLFSSIDPIIHNLLGSIPMLNINRVQLGYRNAKMPYKGFGYLVPSKENEQVLGCMFDSCIFPSQNHSPNELRLTMMLKNHAKLPAEILQAALNAAASHLKISASPDFVDVKPLPKSIPQFELGHRAKIEELEMRLAEKWPRLRLIGNYLQGISVSDCVARAEGLAAGLGV